ncbi:MAG: hypothetical protein Q7T79_03545 [bacterium]|nr:hypothetical protein [bacterium]
MKNLLKLNKKLLLLSQWAPPAIGGPQFLYNLFINIQSNDYFFLTDQINTTKDTKHTGSKLPCKYFFFNNVFSFTKKNMGFKFLKILLAIIKGKKIIKNNKIDILMGISDGGFSFLLTFILSKLTRKPYILFLFDLYRGNKFFGLGKMFSIFFEPILFKSASQIIVTNEGTKKYYIEQYKNKISIKVIHNSAFNTSYEQYQTNYSPLPPYTILFTGHIYWPQKQSIRNLIKAIDKINDIDVKFALYVPSPPNDFIEEFKSHKKIEFKSAPQEEMPQIQSKADILFLPLSWDTSAPDIIKTASPGKLTDYLITGRPILIHAPDYAYISQYAHQYNFAHVVEEENIELLQKSIKKLLLDIQYSKTLIKNATKLFYKNHNVIKNAGLLQNIINQV